jgi:hypothetical protein
MGSAESGTLALSLKRSLALALSLRASTLLRSE